MAEKILDICLNVLSDGLQIELQPNNDCQGPASNPYWFKYWFDQGDDIEGIAGDSVTLEGTGKCRVIAWTEQPGTGSADFSAPTYVSKRVVVQIFGDGTISSGDPGDPWPPPAV